MILANLLTDAFYWIRHPESSVIGSDISSRVIEHLEMTGLALAFALVPALGAGLAIGHTRRAEFVTVSIANLGRAIPSLAILAFVFPITLELGLGLSNWPAVITLFVLAIPPILTNAYVGIREVDKDVLEAARGMGMSERQILRKVEIPLATPLIVAGVRTAAVQVVATATLAALVAGGGLGRFIIDGFATQEYQVVLGGAVLVALLAIATEIGFSILEKALAPGGLRRKTSFAPAYTDIGQAPGAADVFG